VRTNGDARKVLLDVQRVLDGVGPGLAGFFPRTETDHLAIQLLPARVAAVVASGLSVLALALCAIGLYGIVAWFGELRRGEMAIRLALGATRGAVMRLVLGQAFATAVPGMAAGLAIALLGAAAARSLLFGVQPADLLTLVAGLGIVTGVVALASWWPARRAARTDPAETLRTA
jgi:ABC-type antimicrobial peptide transport system permease subunit